MSVKSIIPSYHNSACWLNFKVYRWNSTWYSRFHQSFDAMCTFSSICMWREWHVYTYSSMIHYALTQTLSGHPAPSCSLSPPWRRSDCGNSRLAIVPQSPYLFPSLIPTVSALDILFLIRSPSLSLSLSHSLSISLSLPLIVLFSISLFLSFCCSISFLSIPPSPTPSFPHFHSPLSYLSPSFPRYLSLSLSLFLSPSIFVITLPLFLSLSFLSIPSFLPLSIFLSLSLSFSSFICLKAFF